MASSSQEEIANSTQFCTLLHKYAFLSSYKYNKSSKIINATPQRVGKVINFFTGGWFERFVLLKTISFLSSENLEHVFLTNPQINLPNGDDFELDLIFWVQNNPLWLECKTGNYQAYIAKYADMRPTLGVSKEQSILVVLGISDELTTKLTELFGITVVNETNFLTRIATAMNVSNVPIKSGTSDLEPTINGSNEVQQSSPLLSILNKAGLRPLPDARFEVLCHLIELVRSLEKPTTLAELKTAISDRTNISKSKIQDILNAVVKSNCLKNESGENVLNFSVPFSSLVSLDPNVLECRCIESYKHVILLADPTFFDSQIKLCEFERFVGNR